MSQDVLMLNISGLAHLSQVPSSVDISYLHGKNL